LENAEIIKFQVSSDIFLNCDNNELKRSSKINFSVAEWHRWAEVDENYQLGYTLMKLLDRHFFMSRHI